MEGTYYIQAVVQYPLICADYHVLFVYYLYLMVFLFNIQQLPISFDIVRSKKFRNRFGGKMALLLSLFLTGVASVLVGRAETFTMCLLARFLQGLTNCISGCVKRAAINAQYNHQYTTRKRRRRSQHQHQLPSSHNNNSSSAVAVIRPEEKEDDEEQISEEAEVAADATATSSAQILSIMQYGTFVGPIVGGICSDPRFLKKMLSSSFSSSSSSSHPYLLSNMISATLCWLSMICVAIFVKDDTTKPIPIPIPIPILILIPIPMIRLTHRQEKCVRCY